MLLTVRKHAGAYYTPPEVAASLVSWAVRQPDDTMLDPSCGDGEFLALHPNSFGVDQDPAAVAFARARAPSAQIVTCDFFEWAAHTRERFDCLAGNPPFVRYQTFKGAARARALSLCRSHGVEFSGLASSWAPFLVAAAGLARPGGRMAFVVPAEIGHAPYAAPLLNFLIERFERVHLIAIRSKLFSDLSEDCWVLFADGAGGSTHSIAFTAIEQFVPTADPPKPDLLIAVSEWRSVWNRRLRPFLMSADAREAYRAVAAGPGSVRLKDVARVGIGYVSGANDFFHLRPSVADAWNIPETFLQPTLRKGSDLPERSLTSATVAQWLRDDRPILLLRLRKQDTLPPSVQRYLDTEAGHSARKGYKCRMREPWWSVPDVQMPDLFLTYMAGRAPKLVRNAAGCSCTNSLLSVRITKVGTNPNDLMSAFESPLTRLSCEIEGHALGGGMLKLEPREAGEIVLSSRPATTRSTQLLDEAVSTLRSWRHYREPALPDREELDPMRKIA